MTTKSKRRRDRLTPTQARSARRQRRNRRRRVLKFGAFSAVAAVGFIFIFSLFAGGLTGVISIGTGGPGESVPDPEGYISLVTPHIAEGESHPAYNSKPATSGWHRFDSEAPAQWGVYSEFIPDEILVHNLEHAGVGVHYSCPDGCPELVEKLAEIADRYSKVIMSPYPDMETTIALTAWNYIDRSDVFDEERIEDFIRGHMNSQDAPEPGGF